MRPTLRFTLLVLAGVVALPYATANSATILFPDLKTVPPSNLSFSTATVNGSTHHVLRFSNAVWNAGEGKMELRGSSSRKKRQTRVYQRLYDKAGHFTERTVGTFIFHPAHNHWHFEGFAEYQLWNRAAYDTWIASGRTQGAPLFRGTKTTFCLVDSYRVQALPGSPSSPAYTQCGRDLQGISVGWADLYASTLPEQWLDLGASPLANGQYVLRSVADPLNRMYESGYRADPARESAAANEATTRFTVNNGVITITS
jgi:hypothetical protein